ncbi:MAG: flagellin FliC, partial [Pseudomonadota bacterium]|nr:flagellin FliC [Pseudomonadota bacterium]
MAVSNANDAINMVNTAEGALVEMENMLQRMRELALQASNGTTDVNDRSYLNSEYQALYAEIDRIADNTEWNG